MWCFVDLLLHVRCHVNLILLEFQTSHFFPTKNIRITVQKQVVYIHPKYYVGTFCRGCSLTLCLSQSIYNLKVYTHSFDYCFALFNPAYTFLSRFL